MSKKSSKPSNNDTAQVMLVEVSYDYDCDYEMTKMAILPVQTGWTTVTQEQLNALRAHLRETPLARDAERQGREIHIIARASEKDVCATIDECVRQAEEVALRKAEQAKQRAARAAERAHKKKQQAEDAEQRKLRELVAKYGLPVPDAAPVESSSPRKRK